MYEKYADEGIKGYTSFFAARYNEVSERIGRVFSARISEGGGWESGQEDEEESEKRARRG